MPQFAHVTEKLKHLPVAPIADAVVRDTLSGKVTILAAPTGSGKSMRVPAMLADASDEPVIVLVPRRFLAVDAATNVAQLAEVALGTEVGYAVGKMAGDGAKRTKNTKLVFMTYGYALASGAINKARTIVLDEVHEMSEDISLARAVLHARKQREPVLNILEMSATVDARKQAAYWSDIATTAIHTAEGQAMACDERVENPTESKRTLEQSVIDLIRTEGRKGIAVFRPGIKEIEHTVETLKTLAAKAGIRNLEIASIYSGTPPDERKQAKLPPTPGNCKIIVGTNVIESGVNLRWLDAGVSDGTGRIPYTREDTGAHALLLEDLPQWRILQQRGRVNRDPAATGFDSGIFLLHSERGWEFRPQQATPEIERIAVTNLAFRAASLGIDPTTLHFDATVTQARLDEAKQALIRLQLIQPDWSLTEDGRYAASLPVTPESGALLCEARRLDAPLIAARKPAKLLPDAIVLAAILGSEGMRENFRKPHGKDKTSDLLDAFKQFQELQQSSTARFVTNVTDDWLDKASPEELAGLNSARDALRKKCEAANVNFNTFCDVSRMISEIRSRHHPKELATDANAKRDSAHYDGLKQALLNGSVNTLFHRSEQFQDLLRNYGNRRTNAGQPFSGYTLSTASALDPTQELASSPLVAGTLREVPNKMKDTPDTVITNATAIPPELFIRWAAGRSDTVLTDIEQHIARGKAGEKPTQELEACYFGKAHFTLPLRSATPQLSTQLTLLSAKEKRGALANDPGTAVGRGI